MVHVLLLYIPQPVLCTSSVRVVVFSLQKCANASQALCDMLRVSRESSVQMVGPTPLLGTLERCVCVIVFFLLHKECLNL